VKSVKWLIIVGFISKVMSFISFCTPLAVMYISSKRQGYWKSKALDLEQCQELSNKFFDNKRMWADISYTWSVWMPILWRIAIVLFSISLICIALYFILEYKSRKSRSAVGGDE
jgi:uncharacterized membrane protein